MNYLTSDDRFGLGFQQSLTLSATKYDEAVRKVEEERYEMPDWALVEESIRRLNRFWYPYVWLLKDGPADSNQLVRSGGNGKSHLNVKNVSELVENWESDQGIEAYDFELLECIDEVLAIARRDNCGEKHSGFNWVDT